MYTVAVVTSTRADYGLLRPVLEKLCKSTIIQPKLIVTGTHLSADYGRTETEIIDDGFAVDARIDFLSAPAPSGTPGTALRAVHVQKLFTEYFIQNSPHCVLILGDRYEILAVALAAALLDIPVAHISGGDVTCGAADDWYRHCITKTAKLHFPSCEAYRQRIIRMGEPPAQVWDVGGLGDENIRNMALLSKKSLAKSLGFDFEKPYCLVTFHPETATGNSVIMQIEALLQGILQNMNLNYLFTKANADAGGKELNETLELFCRDHPKNTALFASLGALRYLSAMQHAALVLGNSSSGLVEAPSFGVPVVNIGKRQEGRVRSMNVLDCELSAKAIAIAVQTALTAKFIAQAKQAQSPYNGGNTSAKIVRHLEEALQGKTLNTAKVFYDGEVN